jgi:hypothetical protein
VNVPRALLLLGLAVLAGGCERPAPTAPPARATLERPVLTLKVPADGQRAIVIPRAALVERTGIPGVFVLSEAGAARFRMVKTGRARNGELEILSGLAGNETLVLGSLAEVHDGTPITAVKSAK